MLESLIKKVIRMFESLTFLWKYAWNVQKSYLVCLILYQITNTIPPLLIMFFPKVLLDELMGQNRISYLLTYIIIFSIVIFLMKFLSDFLKNTAFYKRCIILEKFQVELNTKLSKVDYACLEDPDFLNLKQNAEKFLYANGQGFSFVLDRAMEIISKVMIFGTVIWIIASLNKAVLLVFLCLAFLNSKAQMRFKKAYAKLEMEKNPKERELSYFMNVFSDVKYGKEIRMNQGQYVLMDFLKDCLHKLWKFYKNQMYIMDKSDFFMHLMDFFQRMVSYVYMVFMVSKGFISIANFTLYINAIATFTTSMDEVIDSVNDINQYSYYFEAVEKFMNLPMDIYDGKVNRNMPSHFESLEFRNVGFKYGGSDKWALKDINCFMKAGDKIAVVGENGAGKTTFIKLICRLYDPTEGMILLNGVDIKEYDYVQYVKFISTVFQDFQLFSMSLKENVSLSRKSDENRIQGIFDSLGISPFVKKYKKGLNVRVHKDFDSDGFEPSGGVAQKIAISRAIYKDTPIIILDEPTAALDPQSESEIYEQFNELSKNKLAIFISHRMASTRFCDNIIVFKNGSIEEMGSHYELMKAFCILEIIQYAVKILYECRKWEAMMETWELVELPEELELDDEMFDFACCGCACGGGGK